MYIVPTLAFIRRLPWCLLTLALGLSAVLAVVGGASGPMRVARAAPEAVIFPGCAPTLQQCLDTVPEGETIIVQPGTYVASLTLSRAVSLTGVSSSTTILQALPAQRVLTVGGSGVDSSVVISGLTLMGGSAIGNYCQVGCGGGILIPGTTSPRLINLRLIGNSAMVGGAIYAQGELSLQEVEVISNSAHYFAGGVVAGGPVNVWGGRFESNQARNSSGGGLVGYSIVTISGTQFLTNTSQESGGGVIALDDFRAENALFQGNMCTLSSTCLGGGLHVTSLETAYLINTTFRNNSATAYGGGAHISGTASLQGGRFENNQCPGLSPCRGGGLSASSLVMTGTQFLDNSAHMGGGGAYVINVASLSGGLFAGNRCTHDLCHGGGLEANVLVMQDTEFVNNVAGLLGGGAWVGAARLTGGLFQGNYCLFLYCSAGGLFVQAALELNGTQFIANSVLGFGGGLTHYNGNARIVNALFVGNTADMGGTAIHLEYLGSREILHTTITNPTLASTAAILSGNFGEATVGITNSVITGHAIGIQRVTGTTWESHNLFFGNTADTAGGVIAAGGSVTGDPQFVDPAGGDYHIGASSPARDMGVNAGVLSDPDGDPRPLGGGFDAGFDEYSEGLVLRLFLPFSRR